MCPPLSNIMTLSGSIKVNEYGIVIDFRCRCSHQSCKKTTCFIYGGATEKNIVYKKQMCERRHLSKGRSRMDNSNVKLWHQSLGAGWKWAPCLGCPGGGGKAELQWTTSGVTPMEWRTRNRKKQGDGVDGVPRGPMQRLFWWRCHKVVAMGTSFGKNHNSCLDGKYCMFRRRVRKQGKPTISARSMLEQNDQV